MRRTIPHATILALIALFCAAVAWIARTKTEDAMYIPKDTGFEQLVYNGIPSVMPLRGNSSEVLTMAIGQKKSIQWAPTDRRAQDVEVRIVWLAFNSPTGGAHTDPQVFYTLEYGHGRSVVTEPTARLFTRPGGYNVPARGLVTRVSSRELMVSMTYWGGYSTAAEYESVSVQVSFLPVTAMTPPPMPVGDVATRSIANKLAIFPAEAHEWRLFDQFGQPFAPGFATDIELYAASGQLLPNPGVFTLQDRSKYADWSPINIRWAAWNMNIAAAPDSHVYCAYR